MRERLMLAGLAAVVLVGCGGPVPVPAVSPVASALGSAPAEAVEASFTAWSRVPDGDLAAAVRAGLGDDTLTRSTIAAQAAAWEEAFGFSPQELSWEMATIADTGSTLAVGWDGLDAEQVEEGLERAGFSRDGGRWILGDESRLPMSLAGSLAVVELDARHGILRGASRPELLRGRLVDRRAARDVAAAVGRGPQSLLLQTGPRACATAGVTGRGDRVAEQGAAAAERAGGLAEPTWAARAVDEDGFTVALGFGSPGEASEQAAVRERLTTGPFIGRGGAITEVLTEAKASADENVARLSFTRDPNGVSLMGSTGPLLFAGC